MKLKSFHYLLEPYMKMIVEKEEYKALPEANGANG
jgi:hypothetical protein